MILHRKNFSQVNIDLFMYRSISFFFLVIVAGGDPPKARTGENDEIGTSFTAAESRAKV